MRKVLLLLAAILIGLASAWSEDTGKYRVTLKDGQTLYGEQLAAEGIDAIKVWQVDGSTVVVKRLDVVSVERRRLVSDVSKVLGRTGLYIELRPGFFITQNDISEFKPGVSYGGSLGYTKGGHSIEGSFDYFFRAAMKNANNLDTLRLNIAALHYIYAIDFGSGIHLNLGAGPAMVFFSRRGKVTGFVNKSKVTAGFLGGFSVGPFYVYGKYILPFSYDDPLQLPKPSIKYGGVSANIGLRF